MNTKATALAALAISLVACGKETQTPGDRPVVQSERQFLEGVPANTPYVVTAIEPAPLEHILPWLQTLDDAAMPTAERLDELLADPELRPRKRRALALFAELTGHYSPAGLQELGFAAAPRFALYGVGVLPAMRLEIDDVDKVGEFLARVEGRAGLTREIKRSGVHEYWTYAGLRHNRTVVVALQDDVLLMGVTTPGAEQAFVTQLLGDATGPESLDDATVGAIAKSWGLQKYSVGYVDVARLVQFFLAPTPGLDQEIWQTLRASERPVSDACRKETAQIAAIVPRFVFGSENWSSTSLSFGAGLEIRSDLTSQLATTKTGAPLTESVHSRGAAGVAGFAFDVGRVVDIVRTRAASVEENPFQCEWYRGINKGAAALASRWSILPTVLAGIQGGTLLIKDMRPKPEFADDRRQSNLEVDAIAAFATEAPVELFDFVKAFNGGTFELSIDPTGAPLALPDTGGLAKLQSPQIFAQPNALAMTSGAWAPMTAQDLAPQAAPFLFIRYDAEKIADQLQLGDGGAPWRTALRGDAKLELEPTTQGLHFRSTYNRETGE